ncbi:UNKNOWN [Stylonychia lemnae]|uniref:Uncharacterized protein n=1 Tax=Stylonychia lemnae TaxID=5949 RepID=A0A077ZTT4_STYLE|nr:UNKNOWN [Stylonychia lemnae]|eukprot:CDW72974.1 UNKNOWN [Stylonychia lemnae]
MSLNPRVSFIPDRSTKSTTNPKDSFLPTLDRQKSLGEIDETVQEDDSFYQQNAGDFNIFDKQMIYKRSRTKEDLSEYRGLLIPHSLTQQKIDPAMTEKISKLKEGKELKQRYLEMVLSSTVNLQQDKMQQVMKSNKNLSGNIQIIDFHQTQPDPITLKQIQMHPVLVKKQFIAEQYKKRGLIDLSQSEQQQLDSNLYDDNYQGQNTKVTNKQYNGKSSGTNIRNSKLNLLNLNKSEMNYSNLDSNNHSILQKQTTELLNSHRLSANQNRSLGELTQQKISKINSSRVDMINSGEQSLIQDRSNERTIPNVSTLSNLIRNVNFIKSIQQKCLQMDFDISSSSKIVQADKRAKAIASMNGLDTFKSDQEIRQLKLKYLNKKIREQNVTLFQNKVTDITPSDQSQNNYYDNPYTQSQNLKNQKSSNIIKSSQTQKNLKVSIQNTNRSMLSNSSQENTERSQAYYLKSSIHKSPMISSQNTNPLQVQKPDNADINTSRPEQRKLNKDNGSTQIIQQNKSGNLNFIQTHNSDLLQSIRSLSSQRNTGILSLPSRKYHILKQNEDQDIKQSQDQIGGWNILNQSQGMDQSQMKKSITQVGQLLPQISERNLNYNKININKTAQDISATNNNLTEDQQQNVITNKAPSQNQIHLNYSLSQIRSKNKIMSINNISMAHNLQQIQNKRSIRSRKSLKSQGKLFKQKFEDSQILHVDENKTNEKRSMNIALKNRQRMILQGNQNQSINKLELL